MDMETERSSDELFLINLIVNLSVSAFESALMNRGSLEGYIHHTDSDRRYCSLNI
ncbi:MAG: hypothetical protein HS129_03155 [Leptospiraceae bacterium]|nr:hypothetical protein [Leptospiraceae bacterium]